MGGHSWRSKKNRMVTTRSARRSSMHVVASSLWQFGWHSSVCGYEFSPRFTTWNAENTAWCLAKLHHWAKEPCEQHPRSVMAWLTFRRIRLKTCHGGHLRHVEAAPAIHPPSVLSPCNAPVLGQCDVKNGGLLHGAAKVAWVELAAHLLRRHLHRFSQFSLQDLKTLPHFIPF